MAACRFHIFTLMPAGAGHSAVEARERIAPTNDLPRGR
jgi:hypothetical protein